MRATLDLALLVPGLPFRGDTLEKAGLGGSETAGLCLARALAELGHHVQMFTNCDAPGMYDGVLYRHLTEFADYSRKAPHDVTIVQRVPEVFAGRTNSRLNVLWCHDLALGRSAGLFRAALWNVDKIAVLSDFMLEQYRLVYGVPPEVLWKTRNGIDLGWFPGRPPARKRTKLVFGARPERGLDVLLETIFPALLAEEPTLELSIASYSNAVSQLQGFYGKIERLIDGLGKDRVKFLGALTKRDYYRELSDACAYVYPSPSPINPEFAEVSCITAMECQAAGLPIVASDRGALRETIAPSAGVLIPGDPRSPEAVQGFVGAVLRYVRDDGAWTAASVAGRQNASGLDWRGVAEQWTEDLQRFIVERNDSPTRLVRHFIRRSDIMAAREVLKSRMDDVVVPDEIVELRQEIEAHWSFTGSPAELQAQYEKVGQTHTDVFFETAREPRFALLEKWLNERPELQRILDYGCAHGSYAVNLANRVGREWVGVDIDRHSIQWANHNRNTRAANPAALTFRVGTHETLQTLTLTDQKPFDCVLACEVLEHVPDPTAVIDALERWVKPDGTVLLTVPFGPWEWMSYKTYPHRCHLWEFDLHDLRDMFGKKKGFRVSAFPVGECGELQEQLGWHVVEYRVDGTPTGQIDMARKIALQRPRQTVSAVMIAGPKSEETLRWSLEPVKDLVDEIIIGDCGMSDAARAICQEFGAKVIQAANPLEEGFETPRNQALAHARMDFVLWWDTDERLVRVHNVNKYLRANIFGGYSIHQHNFSCDAPHEPTTPCRLFRRAPRASDGLAMRWYGMIHEHPEYALNEGPGLTVILRDVHIAHLGYISGDDQVARFHRNYPLLEMDVKRYPDRRLQKHFLCRDYMVLAEWSFARAGGQLTPEVEGYCREVVKLYREHFLGKGTYLNVDSLKLYSKALKMLGEGVEVAFGFGAADPDSPPEATVARFANQAEAEQELAWRVKHTMEPRINRYW